VLPPKLCLRQASWVQVKCSLEGETRVMHILGQTSYAELLDQVQKKYPAAPPCVLKYTDKYAPPPPTTPSLVLVSAS